MTAPRHVLLELDDEGDLQTVDDDDDRSVSSEALCISSSATSFSEDGARTTSSRFYAAIRRAGLAGKRKTNPVVDGQLVPRARKAKGHGRDASRKRRRDETATTPSTHARRPRRTVDYAATVG